MKLKEITIEQWQDLIGKFPQVSFFHTPEWLQVLKMGFPHVKIKLYVILNKQDKIIGLLPIEFTRKGPFRLAGSPLPGLFTPYQGPLLLSDTGTEVEKVAMSAIKILKPSYFTFSLPPNKHSKMLTGGDSGNWENKKTIIVDLTVGEENLWKGLRKRTRNQVRQAERRGVEICEAKSLDEWLVEYYAMHEAVYSRQGIKPPASRAFYQALWKVLREKGYLRIILAKYREKTIAGAVRIIYEDTIYALDAASLREYRKLQAHTALHWHSISWAASEGLRVYDMVGANIPSIAHFKRGFGGREAEYPYFQMSCGLLGKVGYRLYQRYRPLLKRLGI